jgi:hypothetical protein
MMLRGGLVVSIPTGSEVGRKLTKVTDFILAQDQTKMASTLFTVGPYMVGSSSHPAPLLTFVRTGYAPRWNAYTR